MNVEKEILKELIRIRCLLENKGSTLETVKDRAEDEYNDIILPEVFK